MYTVVRSLLVPQWSSTARASFCRYVQGVSKTPKTTELLGLLYLYALEFVARAVAEFNQALAKI